MTSGGFRIVSDTLVLSRFGMMKFVITETIWSSIIFKTIIILLHRGRFVVVKLCSGFSIDPQNFSRGANFYQKLPFFTILGVFKSHNGEILHKTADLGLPPPCQILFITAKCQNPFLDHWVKTILAWLCFARACQE